MTAILTGHGKFGAYFQRFKIVEDPACICQANTQTVEHILWECNKITQERELFRKSVVRSGGQWPIVNSELMDKYTKQFQKFVNSINFESIQTS